VAGIGALKRTMGYTIILVFAIFLGLLTIISYAFFLDPFSSLLIGFFFAGIILAFQLLIGPSIVVATTGLRYLSPGENQWLESKVSELSAKSGIPMPRLAIVPNHSPNAFVFGRSQRSATLAVHQGLLERLNQDEVEGVLGHELGHVKHRDFIVVTLISVIPLVAYLIARTVFWTGASSRSRRGGKGEGAGLLLVAAIGAYIVYILTTILALRLTRLREHYADAYSAYLLGKPRALASGLTKIAYGLSLAPEEPNGARAFFIEDPAQAKREMATIIEQKSRYDLNRDGVLSESELHLAMEEEAKSNWRKASELLSTHPPVYKRILLLREIEADLKSGTFQQSDIYQHV